VLVRATPLEPAGSTVTIRRMKPSTARRLAHALWLITVTLWILALVLVLTGSPTAGSDGGVERGTGLQGMADRLDAIGGDVRVRSVSGEGTTVTGSVPTRGTAS